MAAMGPHRWSGLVPWLLRLGTAMGLSACMVGPDYVRPEAPIPAFSFKC